MNIRHILLFIFILSHNLISAQADSLCNSISDKSSTSNKGIYRIIISGVESDIRNYFKTVTFEELVSPTSDEIVKALNKLNSKDQISHTVWILEETRTRGEDIRQQVYSTLVKVNYLKPSYLLKPMINSYFTNYKEPSDSLAKQVYLLQKRMIR